MPRHRKKIIDVWSAIILLALITLDGTLWYDIFSITTAGGPAAPGIYFLAVSQGESVLTILPDGVTIMTDAGSDGTAAEAVQKIFSSRDMPSYIDLAVISYPQSGDYNGYTSLLDHDAVGAFLYDGRNDSNDTRDWQALVLQINAKHIPLITIGAGDSIHYGRDEIDIISPNKYFVGSAEPSDAAIVQYVITQEFRALLASDVGTNVENILLSNHATLRAAILKAPLSGLNTVAGGDFLKTVDPNIMVIAPGIKNTPSAPSKAMIQNLASSTKVTILGTAQSGTIGIFPDHGHFLLYNK